MDEIVWAVNPEQDNSESLVYYVGNFAQGLLGAAGIRCRLESPDTLPLTPLNSNIRHHLFLGCKEALNNIVKHARATEVTIRISADHETLKITVADNGRGFDPNQPPAPNPLRPNAGNGLRNLEKRLAEIRGTCAVERGPDGGTIVTLIAPWPAVVRE
jgi:signal transduction histidine kinase